MEKEALFKMNLQFHADPPAPPVDPPKDPGTNPPNPPAEPPKDPGTNPPGPPAEPPKGPGAEPPKPGGAPEKYEFKMPDGYNINPAVMEKAAGLFKKANLTQEQAQELINLQIEHVKSLQEIANKTIAGWAEETKKALGADYEQEMAYAAKFRDQFFSPETIEFFEQNGLFNHPMIVKDFIKAGKALAEDKFIPGRPGNKEIDKMKTFFPNSQITETQK